MDKVADKVSQLVKRNSKEKLTEAAAPEPEATSIMSTFRDI